VDRPFKQFLDRHHYSLELWAFTPYEMADGRYKDCKATDPFVFDAMDGDRYVGFQVQRNGKTIGAAPDAWLGKMRQLYRIMRGPTYLATPPILRKPYNDLRNLAQADNDEETDIWRWVRCTEGGTFIGFKQQESSGARQIINRVALPAVVKRRLESWGWLPRREFSEHSSEHVLFPVFVRDYRSAVHQLEASLAYRLEQPDQFMWIRMQIDTDQPHAFDYAPTHVEAEPALSLVGWWTKTFSRNHEKPQMYGEMKRSWLELIRRFKTLQGVRHESFVP
jgi:hypothetical protein